LEIFDKAHKLTHDGLNNDTGHVNAGKAGMSNISI
jgi:hypothetical protein